MRNGVRGMLLGVGAVIFVAAVWNPEAPQGAMAGGAAPQLPAGRDAETPVLPAPRLPDGTVNLGRVPGEKGYWRVPYITNMGMRLVGRDGHLLPEIQQAQLAGRAVGAGGAARSGSGRGGAASEPWIPWMPWSAALYDYNSRNTSKYRPGRLLPAARRAAPHGHAVSDGDHPASGATADSHDLRGRSSRLAGNLHGRPPTPSG